MKSDKGFADFLRSGIAARILPLLIIGAVLVLTGSLVGGKDSEPVSAVTEEQRLEELLASVEGVGKCRVMITYGEHGKVYSVAVLCDGAESVKVKSLVIELVSSLFGIGVNRIAVLPYG